MKQKTFEQRITRLYADFYDTLPEANARVRKALEASRTRVFTLIAENAVKGKLDKKALLRILTALETEENRLYEDLAAALRQEIRQAAEDAGVGLNEVLIAAGVIAVLSDDDEAPTDGLLAALGLGLLALLAFILRSTMRRKDSDGKALPDRLRKLSREIRLELAKELRRLRNKDIGTMLDTLKKIYGDAEWRVDRLTESEASYAFRRAVVEGSKSSGVVEALRIIDFPHGKPSVHRRHKCYEYSHANEHGLGRGIYPIGTAKILNPHPQCRSIILPVAKGGVFRA